MDQFEKYHQASLIAFSKVPHFVFINDPTEDEMNHIIEIGASVMMTRDGVLPGGSFVHAIVNNDLATAVGCADRVCERAIKFFVHCNQFVHPS